MSMSLPQPLVLTDPKLTALSLALGGRLLRINQLPTGRLEFVIDRVPADLQEQVLNDTITVSAKRFIDSMEGVLSIIAQRRRSR
jgi:hypothetical protein